MTEPPMSSGDLQILEELRAIRVVAAELTDALTVSETQTKKTRRLGLIAIALGGACFVFTVLSIVGGIVIYKVTQDNGDALDQIAANAVVSCKTGNRLREGQRDQAQEDWKIQDTAAKAQGYAKDSALVKFYAERLEWQLNDLYPLRDCDHLDREIPEPGPPPSFKEALEETLREQNQ